MKAARLVAGAACLVGLAAALPAGAEPLGRLFFTPERRAALERQRQLNIQETQQVIEGATLTVSGVVRRSSGRTTTWVNNTPQEPGNAASGVRVEVDRANPARATVVAGEGIPRQPEGGRGHQPRHARNQQRRRRGAHQRQARRRPGEVARGRRCRATPWARAKSQPRQDGEVGSPCPASAAPPCWSSCC